MVDALRPTSCRAPLSSRAPLRHAPRRPALAVLALLIAPGAALAQSMSGGTLPPSGTLAQALPFAGNLAPGSAAPAGKPALKPGQPATTAPAPSGTKAAGDPHTILPQPPPGKAAIGMSARYGEKEGLVPRGLVWRVFADRPEPSGAYPLVAEAAEPAPVFFLSPGGYVVHVSYGLASVARRIVVGDESRREQITVSAGGIRLHADVGDKQIPPQKVTFDIFEGSFLQGRASSRPYFRGANAGDLVVLPAGDYYVVSTYGEGNAVIQADIAVAAGKVADATLHHRAAEVVLHLVSAPGTPPLADAQWSVLSPGGDSIKESINANPVFVLAEGEYTAVARYEGKTYTKDFKVEAGQDGPVEVVVGEQAAPPSLNTDEGSGD